MIDLLIVALYLISLLIIGIYTRSRKAGFKSFTLVKGKDYNHGKLILVATIFASSIGGGTTFGISEKAFAGNIAHSYGRSEDSVTFLNYEKLGMVVLVQ